MFSKLLRSEKGLMQLSEYALPFATYFAEFLGLELRMGRSISINAIGLKQWSLQEVNLNCHMSWTNSHSCQVPFWLFSLLRCSSFVWRLCATSSGFHGQTVKEDLISMRRYRVCGLLGMASLGHSAGFPRSSRRSTCNLKDNFA